MLTVLLLAAAAQAFPGACSTYETTSWTDDHSANVSRGWSRPECLTAGNNTGTTLGSVGGLYSTVDSNYKYKEAEWYGMTVSSTGPVSLAPRATGRIDVDFTATSIFNAADAYADFLVEFSTDGGSTWQVIFSDLHSCYGDYNVEDEQSITRNLYGSQLDPDDVHFRAFVASDYNQNLAGAESRYVSLKIPSWTLTVCN